VFIGFVVTAQNSSAKPGSRRPVSEHVLVKDKGAVEAGERRFNQLCAGCHGQHGEGGQGESQGPNLVDSWEVRRASNDRLVAFIRDGVRGTAMPQFSLPADQITELSAYVRGLNAPAISLPVHGDVAAGASVFEGKGQCARCHMIRGRGGFLGPDLSNDGARMQMSELCTAILNPGAIRAPGYQSVTLRLRGQGTMKGIVRHQSRWSLQILDEKGELHLLHGDEMGQATLTTTSWMPDDYSRRLTADEVDNVVAFLSRQAGQ
jgi:putative heme-binding domain-containing protein